MIVFSKRYYVSFRGYFQATTSRYLLSDGKVFTFKSIFTYYGSIFLRYMFLVTVDDTNQLHVQKKVSAKASFFFFLSYLYNLTLTYGHSNSEIKEPSLEKTATWNLLPCESPIKTSPASLISIPFGKFVIFSQPIRRKNLPSSLNTTTQCPLKSQTKYSFPVKHMTTLNKYLIKIIFIFT